MMKKRVKGGRHKFDIGGRGWLRVAIIKTGAIDLEDRRLEGTVGLR